MKINKRFTFTLIELILSVIILMVFIAGKPPLAEINQSKKEAEVYDYTGEKILYLISPLGRAEYNNLGMVDLNGARVNLVTLRTKVLFIDDMEKIYSDPVSLLPIRIERTTHGFFSKEYKTEEYDQEKFRAVIRTFKGKKLVKEQIIEAKTPIQNVILLLFFLRNDADLKIGWNCLVAVPDEFKAELASIKLELVSIDQISVPAGKFQGYHFKCTPNNFEFWINKDDPRVPLRIKIKSFIDFNVLMKKYSFKNSLSKLEAKP